MTNATILVFEAVGMQQETIHVLLIEDDPGYARLISEMTKNVKGVNIVVFQPRFSWKAYRYWPKIRSTWFCWT